VAELAELGRVAAEQHPDRPVRPAPKVAGQVVDLGRFGVLRQPGQQRLEQRAVDVQRGAYGIRMADAPPRALPS